MSKTHDAGVVTAYGAAVRGGYTGTYEEFCTQQAEYAEHAREMEQAVRDVEDIKSSVESSVFEAENYANSASAAATRSSESASNASNYAISASQSANSASSSANTASQSAASAQTSANDAEEAEQSAQGYAQSAERSAESAAGLLANVYTKPEIDSAISKINGSLGDVKADLDATNNDLRKMVGNIPSAWVQGGMYVGTGIEYPTSSIIRTPFIKVEPGDTIYFDNPDTSLMVTVLEFANNTPTSAGVNERLAVTGVTSISNRVTLSGTTNYIRLQMGTSNTLKGDDVLVYTKHNVVFDRITEASEAIKNEMNGKFASEPIIPIIWEQGRLSTSGTLVTSAYVIRSKDFIYVDDKRRSISVMFGDYALPDVAGITNMSCIIFEYSAIDPITLADYYEYKKRDGNFVHNFAQGTVAFKVTLAYMQNNTALITPDKGYLITPMWAKDGLTQELSGKQDALTFDDVPTSSSSNPVKSGGVYSAVAGATSAIADVKSTLDATNNDISKLIGNISCTWAQGAMYATTGIEYSSNSVIRTPFVKVTPGDKIYFENPDTTLSISVFEFASDTTTASGTNERLALQSATSLVKSLTLGSSTNYIRLQMSTGNTLKGDDVLVYVKNGVVFESIDGVNSAISSEPVIPILWEQGRLSTAGELVPSNYAIRSNDFIQIDNIRRSVSVLFGDYDLPSGSSGLQCIIFEYTSTNPVALDNYYPYNKLDGNVRHTFAQNTVAFKITIGYLSSDTYTLSPDKGYLITPMWAKDGLTVLQDWDYGKYTNLVWETGRLTATGDETNANPPRIRTEYIYIHGIKKLLINAPDNTQFTYNWFGRDKGFIIADSYTMGAMKSSNRTIVDIPSNAYYLRLVVGKLDNSAITTTYGNDISVFNFEACSNGEIINNPPMLSIMDDDGFIKFYTDLYPILADRKVPACSAVIVGQVGLNANRMTWAQIEEMYQNGIEIISHTYSHWPDSNDYPVNVLANDYQKAINVLHMHGIDSHDLGVLPQSSGTIGRFRDAAKQTYKGIFVNGEVTNHKGFDPYSIRRYKIGNNTTTHYDIDALKALIDTLISGWMILSLHTSTADGWVDGTGEGSSAYIIGQAIDYALSKGIPIVTCECGFKTYSTEWNCTQVPDYK